MKTPEEIRIELGMSQAAFVDEIKMSRRTYIGRFDGSQPKWLLTDIINIARLNKGEVRIDTDEGCYEIKIKEIK